MYLLQHRIRFQLLQHVGEWTTQDSINDVHVSIGGHQIRLDDGGIHTASFNCQSFVVVETGDHIEVEEFLLVVCGDLGDLESNNGLKISWVFVILVVLPNWRSCA